VGQNLSWIGVDYLAQQCLDAIQLFFKRATPALHQNIYGYTRAPGDDSQAFNTNRSRKTFFFASNQCTRSAQDRLSVLLSSRRPCVVRLQQQPTLSGDLTFGCTQSVPSLLRRKDQLHHGPKTLNPACLDPVASWLTECLRPIAKHTGEDSRTTSTRTLK